VNRRPTLFAAAALTGVAEISWTSSTGQGGDLPNGTFGADQDVVVQEIQAVNR
jgi:hypothetical protein